VATVIPGYSNLLKRTNFRNGLKLAVMNNTGLKGEHSKMIELLLKLHELIEQDLKKDVNYD
jgi:NOL1/NOP2/fmu family ribosome biogenesis protein